MRISNKEVAHLLRSVAAAYILEEKNRFRILAYENAADAVEHLNRQIQDVWEAGQLQKISGIGATIASNLDEYFRKGDNSYLIKAIKKFPASIYVLMKVPGIGPKRAYKLVKSLHIENETTVVADLIKAAKDGRIGQIEGFGEKSALEIENSLNLYKSSQEKEARMPLTLAHKLAEELKSFMLQNPFVRRIDALGSLRRWVVTTGDIDLAVVAARGKEKDIIQHFLSYPGRVKTVVSGPKKATLTLASGYDIDLRVADEESYGAMLQYNTGSKAHNIKLRDFALKKGYSLSEYGIKKIQNSKLLKFKTEEEFYKFLGLQYIPPEIREGTNEVDLAAKNKIPILTDASDIKGEFHIHSNFDLEPSHDLGRSSLTELIKHAQDLKYDYIAISDHNPSVGNHKPEEIVSIMKKRMEFFKKASKGFEVLVSCEVDILPDGKIALPQAALDYVDMIIVSIHSSFRQPKHEMTKRILKALSYPKVRILGHPTARLIGRREEIEVNWEEVFAECKKRNIAIEINSSSMRLDLPDSLVQEAKEMGGIKFAINTDSHEVSQMDNMFYGVSVARRGWLTKNDIINTKSYKEIRKWVNK